MAAYEPRTSPKAAAAWSAGALRPHPQARGVTDLQKPCIIRDPLPSHHHLRTIVGYS